MLLKDIRVLGNNNIEFADIKSMKFKTITIIFILFINSLLSANEQIVEKYAQSKYCKGCHPEQVKDWQSTWHSKSHYSKNTLYKKTLEYMSKKLYKDVEQLSVECAKCHNPRISVQKVNKSFVLAKAFGVKNKDVEAVHDALNTSYLKEGINCIVCHNTDKINHTTDLYKRGFDAVEWGPNHIMVGPFDSNRTNFHKSERRSHFNYDVNRLCFVCHFGGENNQKVPTYTTGKEYLEANTTQKCADCHMSKRRTGVIAPHVTKEGVPTLQRELRSHLFAGVRNSDIAKNAIALEITQLYDSLEVTLINQTPHTVPTGFGGRALEVKIDIYNGEKIVMSEVKVLDVTYVDAQGNITIPYLSTNISQDLRLKVNEKRVIPVPLPAKSTAVEVTVNYKLINETLKQMLQITDPVFTRVYPIASLKQSIHKVR